MVTRITENISKQFRLASVLMIICLFAVTAAAYEEDFYIVQNNGAETVMDVAANDVNPPPTSQLRSLDPTTENGNFANPFNGKMIYLPTSTFFGFDTFRYDYGPFTQVTRVYILVIPSNDNATDAGEGWCRDRVGQPVNVMNGNMWLKQQDYLLPGLGEPIEIARFYNSITQANGLFGFGWTSQYDEALTIYTGDKLLRLRSPDGRAVYLGRRFTTEPFTSFSSAVTGSIVKETDLSYTLTYKDGRKRNFSPTGRLMWQRDRNGNQTTLNYTNNVLTSITDAAGRVLSIVSNANGTVAKICDGTGTNPCLPGEIASYTYFTSTTRLQTVNYIDGSKYDFEYDITTVPGKVLLTTVKDALNNIVETHVYDPQLRATTSERHGGAEKYTLVYGQTDPIYGPFTSVTHRQQPTDPPIESKYFFTRQSATNLITRIDGSCACGGSSQVIHEKVKSCKCWHLNKIEKLIVQKGSIISLIAGFGHNKSGDVGFWGGLRA